MPSAGERVTLSKSDPDGTGGGSTGSHCSELTEPRISRTSRDQLRTISAISDYALIGDCRTAALVSASGSVDWLCLPDFSSPSVFAAILDQQRGGRFAITPAEAEFRFERRYLSSTAVLETTFSSLDGAVRITDALIVGNPADLSSQRELLRVIECLEGNVVLDVCFEPRPGYARSSVPLQQHSRTAFTCASGNEHLLLRCDAPLDLSAEAERAEGRVQIRSGQKTCFSLAYSNRDIGLVLPTGEAAVKRLEDTAEWWRAWSPNCRYDGPHREAVLRSAMTLKLMTFALSGAVVAAPTSSLPEAIGGKRNWDYRYCWLRDAALTMRAFLGLGLMEEAAAFLRWLLHATALTQPRLSIMYDIYGRSNLEERELDHLGGYRDSKPVRVGNGAHEQLQWDVYGGVVSAAVDYAEAGGSLQSDQLKLLAGFGKTVCAKWLEPDSGIWEVRGEKRHYTFSKVMCWHALDCLVRLSETSEIPIDREELLCGREAIRSAIEERAWREHLGSYSGALDEDWLDASVLLMSCLGYTKASDQRMHSTADTIIDKLGCNGLIYRYEHGLDGFDSREGAFGLCSFWAVDNLAMRGEVREAEDLFVSLLSRANDVGLYSEEIDPDTGEFLGNFPQAFTHVGLINAALSIEKAKGAQQS